MGVAAAVINLRLIGGTTAGAGHDVVPAGDMDTRGGGGRGGVSVEVLAVGNCGFHAGGAEGTHKCGGRATTAIRGDIDIIGGVGRETAEGIGGSCIGRDSRPRTPGKSRDTVFNIPLGGGAVLLPSHSDGVAGGMGRSNIRHARAVGDFLDGEIIDEEIVDFGIAVEPQGDIVASAEKIGQIGSLEGMDIASHLDSVDGYEGRSVIDIGDDAHLDKARRSGRVHSHPEGELQGVKRIQVHIDRRQDGDNPVGVCAGVEGEIIV